MSKILFIAPYPFDEAPSQRFRFEQYFSILKKAGFEIEEVPFLDDRGWKALYQESSTAKKMLAMFRSFRRRFGLMFRIRKFDHIFIHREASMIGPPFFEWVIAKVLRKKFIYDFDDAIWLPNYSESNAKFHKLKMYRKVNKIMKWAHQISAGNEFLAEYAAKFNSNIEVIPTTVDMINVHNKLGNQPQEVPVIGWTGSHTTAQYIPDLLPVLDEIYDQIKFKLVVISNLPPEFDRPYLDFIKWNGATEIKDLTQFNIGIMPLEDTEWTQGKCGFKAIQYMSLCIPTLLSPVGVNKEIVVHGESGYFCATNSDWKNYLIALLTDSHLRSEIGLKGQEVVQKQFSVKSNQNKFLQLFQS